MGAGTPAASFIKFTTNLLSAAIKDAVFVEGGRRDKVPRGEKKGPFLRSRKAHPNRPASQSALPGRGGRHARQMALAPQFPAAFPGPDSDQAEGKRERRRERHRPV